MKRFAVTKKGNTEFWSFSSGDSAKCTSESDGIVVEARVNGIAKRWFFNKRKTMLAFFEKTFHVGAKNE